jgi:multidrug resistance efflux pump
MKNVWLYFLLGLVIVSSALFAYYDLQFISTKGIVKAGEIRNIVIDFPAFLKSIEVKEGQSVKLGDVLFTLNNEDCQLAISKKREELDNTKNELQKTQTRIIQLKNTKNLIEEKLNKSEQELANKKELFESSIVTQKDFEDFKQQVASERKDFNEVTLTLSSEENDFSNSKILTEKIKNLESELNSLQCRIKDYLIEKNIVKCPIKNGVVKDINYTNGDMLSSDKKVLSILDLDSIYIEAKIAERYIKNIRVGAKARIIPFSNTSKKYNGIVKSISNLAFTNNDETYFLVNIQINDPSFNLSPNQNVDVKINKHK